MKSVIHTHERFSKENFYIETKFAKFYKVQAESGKLSIVKVFKKKYSDFFSIKKYKLLQNINSRLMVSIEHISNTEYPYVQYEYFESMTLKDWLHTSTYISKETLLSVLTDMASIIDLFHYNNLVHLDIVGNFLINVKGEVKLNDYDYVEELNDSGKYKIDLHSFFELVYRLIYFLDKKTSTRLISLDFEDSQPDYSTCKNFLNSLSIK